MRSSLDIVSPENLVPGMGKQLVSNGEACGGGAIPEIHAGGAPPCFTSLADTGISPDALIPQGGFEKRPLPQAVDMMNSLAPSLDHNTGTRIQRIASGLPGPMTTKDCCDLCRATVIGWLDQYVGPL